MVQRDWSTAGIANFVAVNTFVENVMPMARSAICAVNLIILQKYVRRRMRQMAEGQCKQFKKYKKRKIILIFQIGEVKSVWGEMQMELIAKGQKHVFKVDTGADTNVISVLNWRK